jgi:hypothetical protein
MGRIIHASVLALAVTTAAGAETWSNSPSGSLLCIELTRQEARQAFFLNKGLTGATFCASFPSGEAVLILRSRHRPPCLDNGVRTDDGAYRLTGKCGPELVQTD